MGLKHAYTSTKSDSVDSTLVGESKWNADHTGLASDSDFIALAARVTALETGSGTVTVPGYYISPTGSDSTGNGTMSTPWKTPGKFYSVAAAGDTCYVRGGSYTGLAEYTVTGKSGTSSAPITLKAYPGEAPVLSGVAGDRFLMFTGGSSYHVIDGLDLLFSVGATGVIWMGDASVSTHHFTIRKCTFRAVAGQGTTAQQVYGSYHGDDITVEDNLFLGQSAAGSGGTGVNLGDHDPGPLRFLVQRNIFDGFGSVGAIWLNAAVSTGSILHNTFVDNYANVRMPAHDAVTVRDNAGTTAINGASWNLSDPNDSAKTTADHNFWAQTFDANYLLTAGQSGRSAASDGTDAGALDW